MATTRSTPEKRHWPPASSATTPAVPSRSVSVIARRVTTTAGRGGRHAALAPERAEPRNRRRRADSLNLTHRNPRRPRAIPRLRRSVHSPVPVFVPVPVPVPVPEGSAEGHQASPGHGQADRHGSGRGSGSGDGRGHGYGDGHGHADRHGYGWRSGPGALWAISRLPAPALPPAREGHRSGPAAISSRSARVSQAASRCSSASRRSAVRIRSSSSSCWRARRM